MHSAEYLDTLPPLPKTNKVKINIYMSLLACTFFCTQSLIHQICL